MNAQDSRKVLRLLEKGRRGLFHALFSRLGLIVLLFLVQLFLLCGLFLWFAEFIPHFFGGTILFNAVMIIYLLNSRLDPSAKLTWLLFISVMPVFGALMLLYTKSDIGHRFLKKRTQALLDEGRGDLRQSPDTMRRLEKTAPGVAAMSRYVARSGAYPVWEHTAVTYFPQGEDKFAALLEELRKARHFIFLEYFIVDEGDMWGEILSILADKAQEGLEIRVLVDGTCEFSRLSHDYPERMRKLSIKCKYFAPMTPFVSTHYNYRDHRKIVVIDGNVGFTGGVNLADEYINRIQPYGHWKDTAIMLEGPAVRSLTEMFLSMWAMDEKSLESARFLAYPCKARQDAPGFVLPYSDCPVDSQHVGEQVYIDILNRAHHYVHIMTPYLIIDNTMESAIRYAAERGVDVHLILPGIPDKKYAFALAHTHYAALMESGVKISEYTPGFVHAKVFVADDHEAVVGTINLDYRSLYHHFECAAYLLDVPCIPQIEADFQKTLKRCRRMTPEKLQDDSFAMKLSGRLLKAVAPLM